jgi:uncharacterized membrane protein
MELLIAILAAGIIMGVLDFIWLGFIAKKLYYNEMGDILLTKPNMIPALLFYVIYVVGSVLLVVEPALSKESWQHAIGIGALFGFVAYATYDLTNLATMKSFSKKIVVIDLIWGTFITTVVAGGAYVAASWIV